ncbi:sodium channel subunit beta-4 isoform X2 [Zonotrichia leucophrys gambelii]|uniref:sodium channel subunit beta-4 isoform X2 n=1 Tax=Zonotrichia leucophrys gambelii TaxID=257770 RepID=UPI00314093E6
MPEIPRHRAQGGAGSRSLPAAHLGQAPAACISLTPPLHSCSSRGSPSPQPATQGWLGSACCWGTPVGGVLEGKVLMLKDAGDTNKPCLHVLAIAFALEVSVGKTNTVTALNNSNVLLPCTFATCIGFQDLVFKWYFNTTELIYHGKIKAKTTEPTLVWHNPRVEFVGSTTKKDNNISIVLNGVEFSDAGKYTCYVKNPKERNAEQNATIFLTVVHKMVETDNTVTIIILSVVGGLIGLLILFMLIKRVVLFIIKKMQDGKKECLVSSSGNDNTENGLAGSKAEQKAPPKA